MKNKSINPVLFKLKSSCTRLNIIIFLVLVIVSLLITMIKCSSMEFIGRVERPTPKDLRSIPLASNLN
jgi:hypothetical protein